MLTKILLVAILILLTWSSVQTSNNHAFLSSKIVKLKVANESIQAQTESNEKLINQQNKASEKLSSLSTSNESILKKISGIEKSIETILKTDSKDLVKTKGSIEKIKSAIDKQTLLLADNKKAVDLIKKSNSEIKGLLYKVSKNVSKHASSLTSMNLCRQTSNCVSNNQVYTKKTITKPQPIKAKPKMVKPKVLSESASLNKLYFQLYKTREFQKKKQMKEALVQLVKLKSALWKSRDHKNISKEQVMSTLSSIDITKKKWDSKEIDYSLDKIEQKLNRLICKPGVCK